MQARTYHSTVVQVARSMCARAANQPAMSALSPGSTGRALLPSMLLGLPSFPKLDDKRNGLLACLRGLAGSMPMPALLPPRAAFHPCRRPALAPCSQRVVYLHMN